MKRAPLTVVFCLLLVLTPALAAVPAGRGETAGAAKADYMTSLPWHIETVDVKDLLDMGPRSLVLDGDGRPHIAYGKLELYYAWHDGSDWHLETVDSTGDVGECTSLVLDASDHPNISYRDGTNGDLKFARFDGADWQIETVDSTGDVGWHTSLVLDASDHPNISYYDVTNGDLKVARFDGANWQIEVVDSAGDVGQHTALGLDGSGQLHASYRDVTNQNLKYARLEGETWTIATVDAGGDVGEYSSLAIDASDQPHISYFDRTNGDLKYAYLEGETWYIATIDSDGVMGGDTSLALDASGRPSISYAAYGGVDDLKFAQFDGSAWQIETIDSAGLVGFWSSLAVDASGRPHISYYDTTNTALKYAWRSGPTVLLPLVLRYYPHDPYYEPNDHWLDAYGPLASGQAYLAYPDDENDYYYFTLTTDGIVDVMVSNYEPTSAHGDLLVYGPADGDLRGPLVDHYGQADYQTEMRLVPPLELGPGKYYVLVYTSQPITGGQLYTLRVTY